MIHSTVRAVWHVKDVELSCKITVSCMGNELAYRVNRAGIEYGGAEVKQWKVIGVYTLMLMKAPVGSVVGSGRWQAPSLITVSNK